MQSDVALLIPAVGQLGGSLLLRTAGKRREVGVNATVPAEKQEERRIPNADGDGFILLFFLL
jgi:hypothetical protein